MSDRSRRHCGRIRRRPWARLDIATALVCAVGLLFWARLIVISDLPRTAIADDAPPAASDNGGLRNDKTTPEAEANAAP